MSVNSLKHEVTHIPSTIHSRIQKWGWIGDDWREFNVGMTMFVSFKIQWASSMYLNQIEQETSIESNNHLPST